MRAAALIGVVDQIGVALDDVAAIRLDNRGAASREGAHVQGQHDMLCDHIGIGIQNRAGGVLGFAHDGGVTGAEQRVLHLLHDAREARLDDLEIDDSELSLTLRHLKRSRW